MGPKICLDSCGGKREKEEKFIQVYDRRTGRKQPLGTPRCRWIVLEWMLNEQGGGYTGVIHVDKHTD
jgi:hypothetical protein